MNINEFAILAQAIKTYYPREKVLATKEAMELWYHALSDIPYDVATGVLYKWVSTERFVPTIADFREGAATLMADHIPDWSEGWNQVLRAIRVYGYYRPDEALNNMDEMTRECVKRIGFLEICTSENIAVDRANFRQIYNTLAKDKKEDQRIPKKFQEMIERVASREIAAKSNTQALMITTDGKTYSGASERARNDFLASTRGDGQAQERKQSDGFQKRLETIYKDITAEGM